MKVLAFKPLPLGALVFVLSLLLTASLSPGERGGHGGGQGGDHGGGGGGGGGSTQTATTFSGRAAVVQVDLFEGGPDLVVSDTGNLPSKGGAREKSLLEVHLEGDLALDARVLHATTVGQGTEARSEASVADLNLTVAGVNISADFLMARANAVCADGNASISGSSDVVNLSVAGQLITVDGQPNQTVTIPTGPLTVTVIINEQAGEASGASGQITVNALHVVIDSALGRLAEVIISSAHADISCGAAVCVGSGDFITGGGWIIGPSGAKANFAVAGGVRKHGLWGHLNYIDHGTGMRVKGTSITGYEVVNDAASGTTTTRRITGTAEIDGQAGSFEVTVADNGEPGRNDTFAVSLSPSGYRASGTLAGGNIQLHKPADCP